MEHTKYAYRVIWSEEDSEFVGLCAEFPSLSSLAKGRKDAFDGIISLVDEVVQEMVANGEDVPEPFSAKTYSGKFQVRIPPELHKQLALSAAEEKLSLNRYVSYKLAS